MSTVLVTASISNAGKDVIELSYSDNGVNWGFSPVAQKSAAAVSLAAFNNALWATFRGHTSTTLYVSSSANWGVNEHTGQSTKPAPSITVFQNQLWIAYIGEATGRVEVISSSDGTTWSNSTATGQSSKLAPSITAFQNQLWIAYISEATGQVEVISSSNGTTWSTATATGRPSGLAPSITGFQNQLWIAYISPPTTNRLGGPVSFVKVISSSNGSTWSTATVTGPATAIAPSITVFQNQLWIAYIDGVTGHVALISSDNGAFWSQKVDTGQPSDIAPSLTVVPAVQPPAGLGGFNQYLFASPQGNGWPQSNAPLPPINDLLVSIQITEELTFDPSTALSFQLNCCAPSTGNWKIGWQQYVLIMDPNSTEIILHTQNFGRGNGARAVYAGDSSNQINVPNLGSIPAGWRFQLALQITGGVVTGATCKVTDASQSHVGTLTLNSIGLPLALQSGTVDETWLAPIVVFQLVVVGYAEGAHATFTSGIGFMLVECSTPLVIGNTWAGSNCAGGGGTAESSNCVYSVIADVASTEVVQCFGAPPGI